MTNDDYFRNEAVQELLAQLVEDGEHALTAVDILISFMNIEMLQEERDEIIERLVRSEE
jgi:hypothetical protein